MSNYDGRVAGILGTVIIHLIAAILFMLYQIGTLKKNITKEFNVEFVQVPEPDVKKKLVELPASRIERVLQGDNEMLNIARNLANKTDEKINPADVIDKVKDELIKDGKLGKDNYIDEQRRLKETKPEETVKIEKKTESIKEEKPRESQVMEANYKGPNSKAIDPCLAETAVSTALVSRFNGDINSPKSQSGTLTYEFVAQ